MNRISVPLGVTTPGEPNIASTLWRTVSDQKNRVYFFDSSTTPNAFWVAFHATINQEQTDREVLAVS